MEVIETLMKQHKEIVDLSVYVLSMLDIPDVKENTDKLFEKIQHLSEILDAHMRLESGFLYDELMNHHNILVKGKVDVLRNEMGDLDEKYNYYSNRWDSAEKISNGFEEFTKETLSILKLLLRRIYNEDSDIYPLVLNTS